jgi:hypothetical protein
MAGDSLPYDTAYHATAVDLTGEHRANLGKQCQRLGFTARSEVSNISRQRAS